MTGAATHPAGFAWIAPHARALRTARALFILTSALLALYVSAFAIIVLTCVRLAATDDDSISRPVRNLGGLGIALVIVAGTHHCCDRGHRTGRTTAARPSVHTSTSART